MLSLRTESDGGRERSGRYERLCPSVMAGSDPAPDFHPTEYDLHVVAAAIERLVVVAGLAARFPTGDAGAFPFVF